MTRPARAGGPAEPPMTSRSRLPVGACSRGPGSRWATEVAWRPSRDAVPSDRAGPAVIPSSDPVLRPSRPGIPVGLRAPRFWGPKEGAHRPATAAGGSLGRRVLSRSRAPGGPPRSRTLGAWHCGTCRSPRPSRCGPATCPGPPGGTRRRPTGGRSATRCPGEAAAATANPARAGPPTGGPEGPAEPLRAAEAARPWTRSRRSARSAGRAARHRRTAWRGRPPRSGSPPPGCASGRRC